MIGQALDRIASRLPGPPRMIVLSGEGEFLAFRSLGRQERFGPCSVVGLGQKLGEAIARAACAPDVYGTARLASGVAGLLMAWLIYRLSLAAGASIAGALWAAGLLTCSRWFYFAATCARPDILCGAFGMAAILCIFRWQQARRMKELVLAGICLGLGGLSHPFAMVYALQLAAWVFFVSRGWNRLGQPAFLAMIALLTFSLWLPLIALYPEAFEVQFRNQFGGTAGGPIWQRAVLPIPSLWYHLHQMGEHAGTIQFLLAAVGLVGCTIASWRGRISELWTVCCLAWSSMYLMSVAVGPNHRVIGYWVYPAGLMFVCVGQGLQLLMDAIALKTSARAKASRHQLFLITGATAVMLLLMLPGSGVRTWAQHLKHWDDINYNSPRFARELIDSLPPDAVFAVDTQFTLDFLAAGRKTLLATTKREYFQVDQFDYDYLIISRFGDSSQLAEELGASLIRTAGIEDDKFACYARIYEPPSNRQK
jgi:hypothetical protein